MNYPLIGILGGMGPAATADFYSRLIRRTPADCDQEHIPVVIWADPQVPDRTAWVEGAGPSPVPVLAEGLRRLEAAGARAIAVPCNTAHGVLAEAWRLAGIDAEWINMVEVTADSVAAAGAARAAILATPGTMRLGLYESALATRGVSPWMPDGDLQDRVTDLIADVKASRGPGGWLARWEQIVADLPVDRVVAACTELSVVAGLGDIGITVTDASEELASATVAWAVHNA